MKGRDDAASLTGSCIPSGVRHNADMPSEKVARLGIRRESGRLYFLRGNELWKAPMVAPVRRSRVDILSALPSATSSAKRAGPISSTAKATSRAFSARKPRHDLQLHVQIVIGRLLWRTPPK